MAEVFDFNNFKKQKEKEEKEKSILDIMVGTQDEAIEGYIKIMRPIALQSPSVRNKLIMECTSKEHVLFKNEDGTIINHKKAVLNSTSDSEEDLESSDFILMGILKLLPDELIVTNSSRLDSDLLRIVKEVFVERVKIQD